MPSRKQKYRIGRKKQTKKGKRRTKLNKINNDSRSKQKNKTKQNQQKQEMRYNKPKTTYVQRYYNNKVTYPQCDIHTTNTMMITIQIPPNKRTKPVLARKLNYSAKLKSLLNKYDSFLIISITNISSKQIYKLRNILKKKAQIILGGNTLSRKIIRDYIHKTDKRTLYNLIYALKGQCGFVFTQLEHIDFVKKHIIQSTQQYYPKVGCIAPQDVFIGPGPTHLEPTRAIDFSTLYIPWRINRGQVDIAEQVHLIHKGHKVSYNEHMMLQQLKIKPFTHRIKIENVYKNGEWHTQHYLYAIKMNSVSIDHIAPSVYGYGFDMEQARITDLPNNLINAYQQINGLGLELRNYTWDSLEVIKNVMIKIAVSQYNDELKIGMLVVGYLRRNEKECYGEIIPTQLFAIFLQYYGNYLGIETKKEEIKEKEHDEEEEESSIIGWELFGSYTSSSDDDSSSV